MRLLAAIPLLPLTVVLLTGALPQTPSLVTGLDHIIILVNDLEAAAGRYRAMGFALKPGRPHDNAPEQTYGHLAGVSREPLTPARSR